MQSDTLFDQLDSRIKILEAKVLRDHPDAESASVISRGRKEIRDQINANYKDIMENNEFGLREELNWSREELCISILNGRIESLQDGEREAVNTIRRVRDIISKSGVLVDRPLVDVVTELVELNQRKSSKKPAASMPDSADPEEYP